MRLIDADLLRKNMEFICMGIMAGTEPYNAPLTEIDNAPTVETQTKLVANVTFNKEQMEELVEKAKADILEQIERPQGEWKLHGMIYYCSVCGHDCEQGGNNFCGNCGADMRSEPCSHDCDTCELGVPIDGQYYDDGLPIHECSIRPTEQSEQESKQYALGYQDGFLDAKKMFGGDT